MPTFFSSDQIIFSFYLINQNRGCLSAHLTETLSIGTNVAKTQVISFHCTAISVEKTLS